MREREREEKRNSFLGVGESLWGERVRRDGGSFHFPITNSSSGPVALWSICHLSPLFLLSPRGQFWSICSPLKSEIRNLKSTPWLPLLLVGVGGPPSRISGISCWGCGGGGGGVEGLLARFQISDFWGGSRKEPSAPARAPPLPQIRECRCAWSFWKPPEIRNLKSEIGPEAPPHHHHNHTPPTGGDP